MQKSALQALLEKASQGDIASLQKLTKKLCDRLVFVPIVESRNESESTVKVSVIRVREGERKIIPVFLSQQTLKKWLELTELDGEGMAIYCSDICKALGKGNWLMVDAGSQYWVELDPKYADEIADYEPVEDDEFLEPEQWSMREKVAQKTEPRAIPQQESQEIPPPPPERTMQPQSQPAPPEAQQMPVQATQEVSIVPHPMTVKHNLNPSEKVAQFPGLGKMGAAGDSVAQDPARSSGLKRFRQNDEDDIRSTMDLSALRNRTK